MDLVTEQGFPSSRRHHLSLSSLPYHLHIPDILTGMYLLSHISAHHTDTSHLPHITLLYTITTLRTHHSHHADTSPYRSHLTPPHISPLIHITTSHYTLHCLDRCTVFHVTLQNYIFSTWFQKQK